MGGSRINSFLEKFRSNWSIVTGLITAVMITASFLITLSVSLTEAKIAIATNSESAVFNKGAIKEQHVATDQIDGRLIKLETDIKHIRNNQSENHTDIKMQLNIMQQDIKDMLRH